MTATYSSGEIYTALAKYAEKYLSIGRHSVVMNHHTSNLSAETLKNPPPQKAITGCIVTFVKFCQSTNEEIWSNITCTEMLLDTLVEVARLFPSKAESTKAMVVDFINYIGTMNGVNYELSTASI